MNQKIFPQNPAEWCTAIENGLNRSGADLQAAFEAGKFPYRQTEAWLREAYSEGYSPDFVPALMRNLHGLVNWVYGGADEPYWPGSDQAAE